MVEFYTFFYPRSFALNAVYGRSVVAPPDFALLPPFPSRTYRGLLCPSCNDDLAVPLFLDLGSVLEFGQRFNTFSLPIAAAVPNAGTTWRFATLTSTLNS